MKIKLSIELDVPFDGWSESEVRQHIFDEYINFVCCQHRTEAVNWAIRSGKSPNAENISKHHELWGKITQQPKFTIEKLDK